MVPRWYVAMLYSLHLSERSSMGWVFWPALLLMAMGTAMPMLAIASARERASEEFPDKNERYGITWVAIYVLSPVLVGSILLSFLRNWGDGKRIFESWWINSAVWSGVYVLPALLMSLVRGLVKGGWRSISLLRPHAFVALVIAGICTGQVTQFTRAIPHLSKPDDVPLIFLMFKVP